MKRTYTITIDDAVLLPRKGEGGNLAHPLPLMLSKLKIGESFAWPESASTDWNNLRSIAYGYGKRNQMRFSTRKVTMGNKTQLRFWRLA